MILTKSIRTIFQQFFSSGSPFNCSRNKNRSPSNYSHSFVNLDGSWIILENVHLFEFRGIQLCFLKLFMIIQRFSFFKTTLFCHSKSLFINNSIQSIQNLFWDLLRDLCINKFITLRYIHAHINIYKNLYIVLTCFIKVDAHFSIS